MTAAAQPIEAAQRALARGDADDALALIAGQDDPPALHLRALAHRRAGRLDDARRAFEAALAAAPKDPQVANNFANLLRQSGDPGGALRMYDRALGLEPGYRDAAFNKALLMMDMGDDAGALALLDRLTRAQPGDARAHSARGAVLRKLARHDAAAAAYDAALRAEPGLPTALKGRAQLALERGEGDAVSRYHRAITADPGDLGAVHGYAEALEAEGSDEVAGMLQTILATRPDWIAGHLLLARVRAERGDGDFAASMQAAAAADRGNRPLAVALAGMLAAAERWRDAIAALPPGDDPEVAGLRAHYLAEAGDPAQALAAIGAGSDPSPLAAITAARAHLRLGDAAAAAALLERAVARQPDAIGAWGLLELAWRLTGDPRSQWLSGRDSLIAVRDIGFGAAEIAELAGVLRSLHRTRSHPIGQSLRGGTQTRGALFLRREPILARLRDALAERVEDYRAGLPAAEDAHPLLRHRDRRMTIGGSWSVRLTGSGFHVNHIHPEGVISSACYVALPDPGDGGDARAGWLELGRPPAELGLALEPLRVIEPQVGRLALFPSYLFHGTRPFADGERLTVAFDVLAA